MNNWTLHRQEVCWLRRSGEQRGTTLWSGWGQCGGGGGSKPGGGGGGGQREQGIMGGMPKGRKGLRFLASVPDGHVSHAAVSATMQRPTRCVRAGLNTAAACWCKHNEESCIGTSHKEGEAAVEQ